MTGNKKTANGFMAGKGAIFPFAAGQALLTPEKGANLLTDIWRPGKSQTARE